MDRTRVTAWVAGVSTTIAALMLLYYAREGFGADALYSTSLISSLAGPAAITWALASPEHALARASVPAALALSLAVSAYSMWAFVRPGRFDVDPWLMALPLAAPLLGLRPVEPAAPTTL